MRLAAINAAQTGARVVESIFKLAGTSGIYNVHPLSRQLCDALVVGQHAFLSPGNYQTAGRVLMGGEGPPGFPCESSWRHSI